MTAKTLLPNQHTPLHFIYGQCDCCLCNAETKIMDLEIKNLLLLNALRELYLPAKIAVDQIICLGGDDFCQPCENREKLAIALETVEKLLRNNNWNF